MPRFKAIGLDALTVWARPLFLQVYAAQMDRLLLGIDRADPDTVDAFLTERFAGEEAIVEADVLPIHAEMAERVARDTLADIETAVQWETIAAALNDTAAARASWFANAMTQTSLQQTQETIRRWNEVGGTMPELKEQLRTVWTGPRPDVAAVTETTNMAAQASRVTWQQTGVIWGYNVYTANDDRVRPDHQEIADNGPYPLSDTEHLPPFAPNCRCGTAPVLVNPNE